VLLGVQDVECAGCRARICPRDEQICLAGIDGDAVAGAVRQLVDAASVRSRETRRPAFA
jgi:hypothetical protein